MILLISMLKSMKDNLPYVLNVKKSDTEIKHVDTPYANKLLEIVKLNDNLNIEVNDTVYNCKVNDDITCLSEVEFKEIETRDIEIKTEEDAKKAFLKSISTSFKVFDEFIETVIKNTSELYEIDPDDDLIKNSSPIYVYKGEFGADTDFVKLPIMFRKFNHFNDDIIWFAMYYYDEEERKFIFHGIYAFSVPKPYLKVNEEVD